VALNDSGGAACSFPWPCPGSESAVNGMLMICQREAGHVGEHEFKGEGITVWWKEGEAEK
jgi:hypothetical protein